MQETIEISPAKASELHIAAKLRGDMALEMGDDWDGAYPGWRSRFVEYFTNKQHTNTGQFFLARAGCEVIGITAVSLVEDYHSYVLGRKGGRVNSVYVAPEYRRRGIARMMLHFALAWLRAQGCSVARLNASEEGEALYESLGFKRRREMECSF